MSLYEGESWEAFVQSLPEKTDSERVSILAVELKMHFTTMKGFAEISKLRLIDGTASTEEIIGYLQKIIEAATDASKITDATMESRRK